jgi:hypothetical protein
VNDIIYAKINEKPHGHIGNIEELPNMSYVFYVPNVVSEKI